MSKPGSKLGAALRYADLGYPVFPCASALNPAPLTRHGFKDASTDPEQIEAWWQQFPDACIGLATAGLMVIDIDGPGNPWLANEPEKSLSLAAAPTSLTPGSGRHHIFRRPLDKPWKCTVGQLAAHVDTRTDGGYIVVPPSERPDGSYRWVEGSELDVSLDRLDEPPPWLVAALDAPSEGCRACSSNAANASSASELSNQIPSGQRNATLAKLAGVMRRVGMSQAEIAQALFQVNLNRCSPKLTPREVAEIACSVARYAPDEVSVALIENHYDQMRPQATDALEFTGISSRELASSQYDLEYVIEGLLVRGQPGVLAGPKKSLKTNISIDLALSLATGGFFLQRFAVTQPTRVGVMSGESGAATIQETARRIAVSKGLELEQCDGATWCFEVPQLGNLLHTDALRRFIERHQLEVLILDPTYLMMMGVGDDAGNLFVVGGILKTLAELAQQTGCTPLLCHHLKKGIAEPYEPAELENIAWAGFQEFVRQWLLLNRRTKYDPNRGGYSELWMSAGGSAGHSGLWGINIDERTRQDVGGRIWDVNVIGASEAFSALDEAKEQLSEARKQKQLANKQTQRRQAVLDVLSRYPEGQTMRFIREGAGIGANSIQGLLHELIDEGQIETLTMRKNKRDETGYRICAGGPAGLERRSAGTTDA